MEKNVTGNGEKKLEDVQEQNQISLVSAISSLSAKFDTIKNGFIQIIIAQDERIRQLEEGPKK